MFLVGGSQPNMRAGRFVMSSLNPGSGILSLDSARQALVFFFNHKSRYKVYYYRRNMQQEGEMVYF